MRSRLDAAKEVQKGWAGVAQAVDLGGTVPPVMREASLTNKESDRVEQLDDLALVSRA